MIRRYLYAVMTDRRKDPFSFLVKGVLFLFAFFFRIFLDLREFFWKKGCFKPKRVPLTVISVGNITLGGTGKTPFVKWLARELTSRGKRVAVLTRGYKKMAEGLTDEALELRHALPNVSVWIGKDRVRLAEKALSEKADVVILDDGFQYRRLHRDLDIVLVDALNPFGNGKVLPRGILRENPASLKRADLLVLTRSNGEEGKWNVLEQFLGGCAPGSPVLFSTHQSRRFYEARTKENVSLETLRRQRLVAFCGIGNPEAFRHLLEACGLKLLKSAAFMDHHSYVRKDLTRLDRMADSLDADSLITTEKDFERLKALDLWPSTRLVIVEVEVIVTKNENELHRRLDTLLSR